MRIAIALLFMLGAALATPTDCQDKADQAKYYDAAMCYSGEEQWGLCVYYYLKTARTAELAWNKGLGQQAEVGTAATWYNPDTPKVSKCLVGYGNSTLKDELKEYYDWITAYTTNKVPPPLISSH